MCGQKKSEQKIRSIGVMGGTFDPIHFGHMVTAETVWRKFGIDLMLFIPTGHPPHKNSHITDPKDRLKMVSLAIEDHPQFEVSSIEMSRSGKTYTIDTIEELYNIYGSRCKIYFITGADAVLQIFTWKNSEKLLTMCDFVAVTRPGYQTKEMMRKIDYIRSHFKSNVHFLEVPALDISSTDIRSRVRNGWSIKYLLPEKVEKYIYRHKLYHNPIYNGENHMLDYMTMQEKLQSSLSIKRFIHTMGVADEAVRLAEIHGTEHEKNCARIAGLLHDCAKDYPVDLKKRLCKEYHIPLDNIMKQQIDLTHPFLGAEIAKREYGVEDEDILNAIRYHTTGRKNMSTLEKIVFIADYIEPNREKFEGLEEARKLADFNLNMAMKYILKKTIEYVKERKRLLHPLSLEAYAYYAETEEEQKK